MGTPDNIFYLLIIIFKKSNIDDFFTFTIHILLDYLVLPFSVSNAVPK